MYRISELAERVGLSRSTLLYYEKQGLINGQRLANGYRTYSERDLQRLRLIQKLQAGGLSLKECMACLDAKVDRQLLQNRLAHLDAEIAQKQQSRELLAALLGEGPLKQWHESVDQVAPDAHFDWLVKQGFDEKQALHLKWLSKDMNEHDAYMADFFKVYEGLEYWGPGEAQDSEKALTLLPTPPTQVLEIGCGNGVATQVLLQQTNAHVTAIDNDQPALERLQAKLSGFGPQLTTQCASMTDLPFADSSFDLIWSEGSAYIMGFEQALTAWKPLLQRDGVLVVSDLVWRSEATTEQSREFWQNGYPDLTTAQERVRQAHALGYTLVDQFALSNAAWENYYLPLEQRVAEMQDTLAGSPALADIRAELAVWSLHNQEFAYQMFIFQKAE
uniref:MerR family transcriptional regulator n=1 Tax=Thaumasiovibrio occultus TaxID=1891184 RepID=UPI000B35A504|nr:MerR family transcriptional regulator [Thaumasiovibrio occultus]